MIRGCCHVLDDSLLNDRIVAYLYNIIEDTGNFIDDLRRQEIITDSTLGIWVIIKVEISLYSTYINSFVRCKISRHC